MEQAEGIGEKQPRIIRGRVGSLSLYEITDYELEILEKGSPNSLYLNFSIFLFSIGISFLIALLTVSIESVKLFSAFVVVTVIGLLGSLFLFLLWFRTRNSVEEVIVKIRGRIPSRGINTTEEAQSEG